MLRLIAGFAFLSVSTIAAAAEPLQTVAEKSGFQATSTHVEVLAFAKELTKQFPDSVNYSEYGISTEGRPLPALTLQIGTEDKRPTVLIFANIHAGEVDGKEAVLALARDLAMGKSELLKTLRIVILPNINPDGNDRIDKKNRTEQNGPADGVGQRENADGLDLNRDFVKLETKEIRALLKIVVQVDPLMVVDCHTTNGSQHRYKLTYDGPRTAAAHPDLVSYTSAKLFPDLTAKLKTATGYDSFWYGNFNRDRTEWSTYGTTPRYSTPLFAMQGRLGILSESYSYATYEERVKASYAFVKANLEHVAANLAAIHKIVVAARETPAKITLRTKTVAQEKTATVLGYVEKDGKPAEPRQPKDFELKIVTKVVPTLEVDVPTAYLIPAEFAAVSDTLRRHGIKVEELREQIEVDTETYTVTEIAKAKSAFQKHTTVTVETTLAKSTTMAQPGMFLVRTAQPLGRLAAYLLEPQSEDGLTTWNAFDAALAVKSPFPVVRLPKLGPVFTGAPRPLPEDRVAKKKFTLEQSAPLRIPPTGLGELTWLPDGEHWLQVKEGKLWKVAARSGRAELFVDVEKLKKSLAGISGTDSKISALFTRGTKFQFDADRAKILFDTGAGLVLVYRDGSAAQRLDGEKEHEFPTFSPDGQHLAFVRKGNLFSIAIATAKVTQLTADGGAGEILNGRSDWVYEEEIFNRNGGAFWWSPDSTAIAYMRFDDKPVPKFNVLDGSSLRGTPSTINYPKAGDANPLVSIGVVKLEDKPKPVFLNLEGYKADATVIARVGWVPGKTPVPFAYLQNREQTWLDFATWPDFAAKPKVLFRETTKAWVEDLGEPHWLKDGSFLILSERSGWKQLYHYAADGKLNGVITAGNFDIKSLDRIDEASGDIYFTANASSPTGVDFLMTNLRDPSSLTILTQTGSTHAITLAPKGAHYIDRQSNDAAPVQAVLRELVRKPVRVLDSNPSYDRERFLYGRYERVKIETPDGFAMDAAITYPPDFHEGNRYPIWIMTYAGPHAPTVKDGAGTRGGFEQILAAQGIVVMRIDPRSASGQGAQSAWTCFKQLGVQELKDLETAVDWIGKNPWADTTRVGISGHSYGGYISAYALTHSKKFSAGIAGAPVTDWSLYDSIYTERYMGLPKDNAAGYEKSSVLKTAANLHGKLLIVHGLVDDNVHAQNSLKFIEALQKANKDFDVMVYPSSRHGILSPHYQRTQYKFILRSSGLEK